MRPAVAVAGVTGLGALIVAAAQQPRTATTHRISREPAIVVSANVRVSRDGDFPHLETPIAASPIDARVLIAAGTAQVPDGPGHDRAYVSNDRGATWRTVVFPEPAEHGSADPMVEVGPTGTLYFVTLVGALGGGVVYRSADSGRAWEGAAKIGETVQNTAVDRSSGRFAGRLYIAGSTTHEDSAKALAARVYYSTDDGRTFRRGGRTCVNSFNTGLVAFSDGTLFATCTRGYDIGFVTSADGGETFTPWRLIAHRPDLPSKGMAPLLRAKAVLPPQFSAGRTTPCAADIHATPYRDRIYCVWEQPDSATLISRIHLASSGDQGATWRAERPVDATVPAWATQAMPSLAVNREGVVGVAWFDTRMSKARDRYDVYSTASRDGGATFLPPVRVTSASSFPMGAGNLRPLLSGPVALPESAGEALLLATSPFAGRQAGGDYVGMAADAGGEFHPVWPDARSGTWQVYSTRIRVARAGESIVRGLPDADDRVRTSLKGKTSVLLETSAIDSGSLEITVWARIRNTSPDTLYGPFAVEVAPRPLWVELLHQQLMPVPTVINAASSRPGGGARFDYAGTAGTLDLLAPGDVTEARPWRFRVRYPGIAELSLIPTVSGLVRKPRPAP